MNVLLLPAWYPELGQISGVFFHERAKALRALGIRMGVGICDVNFRQNLPWGFRYEEDQGIPVFRIRKKNWTPFWEQGVQKQKKKPLEKIYRAYVDRFGEPDLIHMDSARIAEAVLPLVRKTGLPFTYTEHYSKLLSANRDSYLYRMGQEAASKADHCFYISRFVKNRLNLPEEKSSYLPNSIDFSLFSLASQRTSVLFHFKALGSLRAIKGYDRLLRAFSLVHGKYPEARLTIGGNGPEWDSLHQIQKELRLEDAVTFAGAISPEEKQDFYQDADAFLCTSDLETFSVVLIEALASGIPVISTKCGGPEDFVNKENGLLAERSISDLARAMEQMIHNRAQYDASSIREAARAKFDQALVAQRQIAVWQSLLRRGEGKH